MSDGVVIETVKTRKQWRQFFEIRRMIYRKDPAAVIPLAKMELDQLDPATNAFYQHAKREVFICFRDGVPVGRIAAIKDDLHNEYYSDKVGFFGFFEVVDDVEIAKLLISTASNWLRENGCDFIRGPVNPSMKSDFGVVMSGHETAPFIMMGHTPLYYDALLQKCGLEVAKQFNAYIFDHTQDLSKRWNAVHESVEKIKERYPKLKFRTVDEANYDETLRDVNRLGNLVRAENYGFVPLTEAELKFMIRQTRRIIRFDMIHVAYWDDQLVGFVVNIPDINWALKKTVGKWDWIRMPQLFYWLKKTPRTRVIALGVHPEYRKKGVAISLIQRLINVHDEYQSWELSWVVEDNVKSMRIINRAMDSRLHKVYRLYEGSITGLRA